MIMATYSVGEIKAAKEQNLELINQRVHSQERIIDYWMAERVGNVRELSQDDAFRTLDEQQIKRALQLKQQHDSNFDSISYIDCDGYFKASTLGSGIRNPSAVGEPYFEAAQANKEYISEVVIGRNSGLAIINFSAPVYDEAGQMQGLILGSVKTATLEILLRENWIGQTGEVFLVDRKGSMLTELRHANVLIEKGLVEGTAKMEYKITDDAARNIRLGESGLAAWVDYRGNKVLGAYLDMPERGWTLIGKIDEAEVLNSIYQQLSMMAGGTVFLVLILLPLATRITNRIKRPIDWLIGQSNLIAKANYEIIDQDKPLERIPYELGVLCETFIQMSRKIGNTVGLLKENEAKLESKVIEIQEINATLEEEVMERQAAQAALANLNAELENKVTKRTQELQDMNATLEEEIMERQTAENILRENRDELAISEARYRLLFENMFHGFAYCEMVCEDDQYQDFIYLEVNDAFNKLTGLRDVIGKKATELIPGIKEATPELFEIYGRVSQTGQPEIFEKYVEPLKAWLLISVYSTQRGYFITIFDNITDRKRAEEDIRHMAYFDMLTGLANRVRLNELLGLELAKARRGESSGAVLFIDLDELKMINDTFGHTCGDALIMTAGKRIVEEVGDNAVVGRIGGDEFMVILPGECDRKRINYFAHKIIGALSQDVEALGIRFLMSASAGIAVYPDDGDTTEEIFKNADNAMYAAKKAGRNCWRFYEVAMQIGAYDKILLSNSLRHAVERSEFVLHYQPLMRLADGVIVGFEALLRWNSPEHGSIPPARFIPLAEQSGLIQTIGQWVLQKACQFIRRLTDLGLGNIRVAVNVSPHQLCADSFINTVREALQSAGVEPCQLELEITENALIVSLEEITRKLDELQALGVSLSLDDFGTGYSSLTYLRRLPVKTLKIDKAFIDMILTDVNQQAIIGTIVNMAHSMKMTVVAEGVESKRQIEYLRQCCCDRIQGYIISRPMPEDQAVSFLSGNSDFLIS